MLRELTLESLRQLDMGKVHEAFQLHLKRAVVDCLDRPGDDKPRKVLMEVTIVPETDDTGDCYDVKTQIHVSSVVPKHRTKVYSMAPRRNGSLAFNEDSPENVNQSTMFEETKE
jgi:hypothetical protein